MAKKVEFNNIYLFIYDNFKVDKLYFGKFQKSSFGQFQSKICLIDSQVKRDGKVSFHINIFS
jgi:hypothetical protein